MQMADKIVLRSVAADPPYLVDDKGIALSSIVSNTGARSPGEALMTCNTSPVAVCCS